MAEEKKYSVSELAELVGVPRTTINDWLSRYSSYIDFEMQGRRKVYPDSALNILKEISGLRDSNLSSFEIEEELAKKHPVHGEAVPHKDEKEEKSETGKSPAPEEFALTVKKQTDEIGRIISEQLHNMACRIDEIESMNKTANTRAGRWYSFALMLFVFLLIISGAASYLIWQTYEKYKDTEFQKINFKEKLDDRELRLGEKEEELEKITVKLEKNAGEFKKNIALLQDNMGKQKKEFEEMLEKTRSDSEKKKEAEVLKLRDKFAAERLELLKKLEEIANEKKSKDELINRLQQQSMEQSAAIRKLSGQETGKENKTEETKETSTEKEPEKKEPGADEN